MKMEMNKMIPTISVILPAYNAADTIAETIQSVLNQSFKDWELLVINDGSKDNTVKNVSSFRDERIHLIHNDENKGLIYTLNKGIELARGPFIARIDADVFAKGWYRNVLSGKKIAASAIKDLKKRFDNDMLLIGLYFSMSKHQISIMLYCLAYLVFFNFPKLGKRKFLIAF